MDKNKLIALILEDRTYTEMLTVEARKELFFHYLDTAEPVATKPKTEQAARLYLIGKQFGLHRAQEAAREYIGGVSKVTMDRRLFMARDKGLLPKKQ
jgi:hypothetical protein